MKIGRDGAVFFIGIFFVALMSNSLGVLVKSLLYLVGCGIGILIVLEVIKNFCKGKPKEIIGNVQSIAVGIERQGLYNFSARALDEVFRVWSAIPDGSVKEKELLFAKQINAVDRRASQIPNSMKSIVAQKALYEISLKNKSLKFHKLGPKPCATAQDILRPLDLSEVQQFTAFCEAC